MPARTRSRQHSPAPISESLLRLGDRLRKARTEAGLSQSQLGAPHFTRAYISALELGKIRPAMTSLEFLAGRLGKPSSHFLEDEEQERKRSERDIAMVRALQLIAEGSASQAVEELRAIDSDGLSTTDRLALKRTLGRAYLEAGEGAKAAAVLAETVRGYEALGDAEQVARTRGQLGRALIALMSYDEAEVHLSQALRASADGVVKDPVFRVHVLHNLGCALYQRGEYKAAIDQFERAVAEGADIGDDKWLASVYAAMGMSLREMGDYEAAITSLRRSETLFDAIRNRSRVAEIRFQMARTIRALGNMSRAAVVAEEALSAANDAGNPLLGIRIEAFIGICEAEAGALDRATERLERIIERADELGELHPRFVARFALAKAISRADPVRAERILRETEDLLRAAPPGDDLADIHEELSQVLTLQGRTEEALAYAQRAYATARQAQKGGG